MDIHTEQQYREAGTLEDALRDIADETPAWLYDAAGIGRIIDDLNRARFEYEQAHPASAMWVNRAS